MSDCKFKVGDKVVPFPTEDGHLSVYLVAGSTYTITKIHKNGSVDVDGAFKYGGDGEDWDSDWFKFYEEKEVKVVNTMTAESLRNSLLSLQQERASLQDQIEQNIAQEKALTQQLKELGFLLVNENDASNNTVEEKKIVLYAKDIEEDMKDPRNWKVGDVIVATTNGYNGRLGVKYRITKVGDEVGYECLEEGFCKYEFVDSDEIKYLGSNYDFHSRPVK